MPEELCFTDFVFMHLSDRKSTMRRETYYTYKSTATKLLRFRKPIPFDQLNERFVLEYREWMLKQGNNENTASKTLRTLRTWMNLAVRYGHINKNPFDYIRIKKVDGKREFLKQDQFNLILNSFKSGFWSGHKNNVIRQFLFSCVTGLRYGDLKLLKHSDIVDGMISICMHKTSLPVMIPLSEKARSLITFGNEVFVFNMFCNKVTNRILKQALKEIGITKRVTFHVARHTFATMSITLGIPIEVVSKLLGHTDLKTTQIYAKVVDSVKIREMQKWDAI